MGRVRIRDDRGERDVLLCPVTVVGRHRDCTVQINSFAIPAHWLELRWRGSQWVWRLLSGENETRGTGEIVEGAFRALHPAGGRIRLGTEAWLRLEEGGPPILHARDLIDGTTHQGAALDRLLDRKPSGVWTLAADGEDPRRVEDGDVFMVEGRPYVLLGIELAPDTARPRVQVRHPGLTCDVDGRAETATFTVGTRSVTVVCSAVKALAVYVQARLEDDASGGWRTASAVWEAWVAAGGDASSTPPRIGWEKGRLRSAITRAGLVDATGLFETRRRDGVVVSRIALPPQRLSLVALDV